VLQDDPGVRVTVEDAAEDQPHRMSAGPRGPAPHRGIQRRVSLYDLPVVGGDGAGVDVERDVKVLQGFPEPGVLRLVQVMAQRVIVDQGSAQAELDGAAQLGGGLGRVMQRDGGQSGEPLRVLLRMPARKSLAVRASATATSGSGCTWMPGLVSDSTCMSTPFRSMSGNRYSVKSASLRCQSAATALFSCSQARAVEPSVASLSYQNDSSRAIIFMELSFHYRSEFPADRISF